METVKCNKCAKEFTKPTLSEAEHSLRSHIGRVHTKSDSSKTGLDVILSSEKRKPGRPVGSGSVKRKYTWKTPRQIKSSAAPKVFSGARPVDVHINFCPNCGCNLKSVAAGIVMAGHI